MVAHRPHLTHPSNKAFLVPELGGSYGPTGNKAPERPLSPPQGQRQALRAPLPSTRAAAGALCLAPSPRRHLRAVGSGTHPGAVGARPLPPT